MNAIALLDSARSLTRDLARCARVEEVKTIRDKVRAIEVYARQVKEWGAIARECVVLRLRSKRRIGELLPDTVKPGKRSHDGTVKLGKLGITKNESSRCQAIASLREDTFEQYVTTSSKPTEKDVLRLVVEQRRARQPRGGASGGNILTGPASQLWDKLADSSVDLFLTDPPYSEVGLYKELAELAASKLKPGGLCLAYCGQLFLPAVLDAMRKHLTYHWVFSIKFSGPHHAVYPVKIHNSWQPVVAFRRGKSAAGWCGDHLHSAGKEKDLHEWQHNQGDVEHLIEKLTDAGALVVDPYCGSGTVPAACQKLRRRWLACELNSQTARVARGRIAA